jgi:ATP-dependent protease Clp ATPase subunit
VNKLVAGPRIYICDACVTAASRQLAGRGTPSAPRTARRRCSFCRRSAGPERRVVAGTHANVCEACLQLCREFMARDAS